MLNFKNPLKSRKSIRIFAGAVFLSVAANYLIFHYLLGGNGRSHPEIAANTFMHIGVLVPKAGEFAAQGASLERGVQLAASVINESGGILGKRIQLHIKDTHSDAAEARKIVQNFARSKEVSLIVGTVGDKETLGAIQGLGTEKLPFIYSADGPLKTCSPSNKTKPADYVWGAGITDYMSVEPFLIHVMDRLRKSQESFGIFYFSLDDNRSHAATQFVIDVAENLEIDTINEEYVDSRLSDYFPLVRVIFSKRPDLLFVGTHGRFTLDFLAQAVKLGVKSEMKVFSISSFGEENIRPLGNASDGMLTVSRYSPAIKNAENNKFLAAWKKAYPKEAPPTTMAAAGGYGLLMLAKRAFDKARSLEAEKFRTSMSDLEVEVPQGRIIVSAKNHLLLQPLYAVTLTGGSYDILEYLGEVEHPGLQGCLTVEQSTAPLPQSMSQDND